MYTTTMWSAESVMEINGCRCTLNNPKAKKDGDSLCLPPYEPRKAFLVDDYPACPSNWMRGSAKAKSYFVPIKIGNGMWLDFNGCWNHPHHIAALISIQGVNPITGQPLIDQAMRLEQYEEKCPVHDKEFGADLFCEDCGYKWAPQNYIATTNPSGANQFWLDGFRAANGTVRQYLLTEETMRGVASQIISDKKVYAIGIAFYQSKERKPPIKIENYTTSFATNFGGSHLPTYKKYAYSCDLKDSYGYPISDAESLQQMAYGDCDLLSYNAEVKTNGSVTGLKTKGGLSANSRGYARRIEEISPEAVKTIEIAAGAKIDQHVYKDPEKIDFWEDSPIGMLYINYVEEALADKIIAAGKRDREKGGEGFLAELVTGNA